MGLDSSQVLHALRNRCKRTAQTLLWFLIKCTELPCLCKFDHESFVQRANGVSSAGHEWRVSLHRGCDGDGEGRRLNQASCNEVGRGKDASLQEWDKPVFAETWSNSRLLVEERIRLCRWKARCRLANGGSQPLLCFRGTLCWAC